MKLTLWRCSNRQQIRSFAGHLRMVHGVCFSPDGKQLVSGGADKVVRMWRVEDGQEVMTFSGHTDEVACVAFSPDGKMVASGTGRPGAGFGADQTIRFADNSGHDEEIRVWNAANGELLRKIPAHRDGILRIAFSKDGRTLASAGLDSSVRLWDTASGDLRTQSRVGNARLFSIAFSPDGNALICGGDDGYLTIWDTRSGVVERILSNQQQVFAVAVSPDGTTIASAGYDKTVKLWDLGSRSTRMTLRSHFSFVWSLAFSPGGTTLASASWDGTVRLWDVATAASARVSEKRPDPFTIAYSKDGLILATGRKKVELWDPVNLERLRMLADTNIGEIYVLKFSPDGKELAAAGAEGILKVWNTENGTERFSQEGLGLVWALAYSPDGTTLVSGGKNGKLNCWNTLTGEHVQTMPQLMDFVASADFSPDGKTLIVSGRTPAPKRNAIHIWDWRHRRLQAAVPTPTGGRIRFSPDGKIFVRGSSAADGRVEFWDADPPKLRTEARGHTDLVWDLTLSPDGRTVATASWDGSVRLWHAATGLELFSFKEPSSKQCWAVQFSPNGRQLVATGHGGRLVAWETEEYLGVRAGRAAGSPANTALETAWHPARAETQPPEIEGIIIGSPAARVQGGWQSSASATDKYGTSYLFKSKGTGSNYVTFCPIIPAAGNYQVFEWHSAGSNRTTNAPLITRFNGSPQTNWVDQQVNGGCWNRVGGPVRLEAGTNSWVRIQDDFPDAGQVVVADAIKFVCVSLAAHESDSGASSKEGPLQK